MPVYVCFCEKQLALGTAKAVISSRGTVHVSTLWTLKAIGHGFSLPFKELR